MLKAIQQLNLMPRVVLKKLDGVGNSSSQPGAGGSATMSTHPDTAEKVKDNMDILPSSSKLKAEMGKK